MEAITILLMLFSAVFALFSSFAEEAEVKCASFFVFIFLNISAFAYEFVRCDNNNVESEQMVVEQIASEPSDSADWDTFTEALIYVESKGWSEAVNSKTNAVGLLQIRKSVVEDCNRILGDSVYTMNDRFSRHKSIEMFNVIQNHYNPEHDLHYALKIWNPKSSFSYHSKVMKKYNELMEE